jgi:alpha,alpha-trehalose phosphorylase
VYGFGGMRDHNGTLTFDPRLPADWPRLTFPLLVRGSRLLVEVAHDRITFTLRDGEATEVSVRGQQVCVSEQGSTVVDLDDQGPVILGRLGSLPLVGSSKEHEMVYTAGVPDRERRRRSSRS